MPKPVNGRLPILIGRTKQKMLPVVGMHADLWDCSFEPDEFKAGLATVRVHAAQFGWDPDEIVGSARAWRPTVTADEFAHRVRAYYVERVRQTLFSVSSDPGNIETLNVLAEQVNPELQAELDR